MSFRAFVLASVMAFSCAPQTPAATPAASATQAAAITPASSPTPSRNAWNDVRLKLPSTVLVLAPSAPQDAWGAPSVAFAEQNPEGRWIYEVDYHPRSGSLVFALNAKNAAAAHGTSGVRGTTGTLTTAQDGAWQQVAWTEGGGHYFVTAVAFQRSDLLAAVESLRSM